MDKGSGQVHWTDWEACVDKPCNIQAGKNQDAFHHNKQVILAHP